jgi:hypothetical protein
MELATGGNNTGGDQNTNQNGNGVAPAATIAMPALKDASGNVVAYLFHLYAGVADVYNPKSELLSVSLRTGEIVKSAIYFTTQDCTGVAYLYEGSDAAATIGRVVRAENDVFYKIVGYVESIDIYSELQGGCLTMTWTGMPMTVLEQIEAPTDLSAYAPLHFVLP